MDSQDQSSMLVKVAAIVAIATIEAIALIKNVDGKFFGLACAIIGGIAGYIWRMKWQK